MMGCGLPDVTISSTADVSALTLGTTYASNSRFLLTSDTSTWSTGIGCVCLRWLLSAAFSCSKASHPAVFLGILPLPLINPWQWTDHLEPDTASLDPEHCFLLICASLSLTHETGPKNIKTCQNQARSLTLFFQILCAECGLPLGGTIRYPDYNSNYNVNYPQKIYRLIG